MLADEKQLPVNPLSDKPLKKCSKCGCNEFEGEKDILDTWFTSSMTPRLAVELMDKKIQDKIFPMSLRPQAHDIITFWLFNTVLKSNLHYGKNPFEDVVVSGFVTLGGEKMSKSKGNGIEPRTVLENYGADCMRYWAAGSKLGEDLDYQENDLLNGKKFITKLWNASKFVFMNLGDYKTDKGKPKKFFKIDELFLRELNKVIKSSTNDFLNYEYSKAKSSAENFFWKSFCDNYMEIVKNRIYNGTEEEKESAKYTLYCSLFALLKMLAPITPFVTEEIYQNYFKKNEKIKSIHLCDWPAEIEMRKENNQIWAKFVEILEKVRKAKSEAKKSMKAEIILSLEKEDERLLESCLGDLKAVCCAREIKQGSFKVEFLN
jgi:valyl-tRNA synthetase